MDITPEEFQQLKQQVVDQAATQDSIKEALDKALSKLVAIETKPAPEVKPEVKVEPKPNEAKVEPKKDDDEDISEDEAVKKIVDLWEGEKKERESLAGKINQLFVEKEVANLRTQVATLKAKYPEMNEKDVMLSLEADPKADLAKLAEASHAMNVESKKKLETEIEARVSERLKKEAEGGKSIPQSSGSAPTPNPTVPFQKTEEDAWGAALRASKQSLGA